MLIASGFSHWKLKRRHIFVGLPFPYILRY